jgi:hypothetical protein
MAKPVLEKIGKKAESRIEKVMKEVEKSDAAWVLSLAYDESANRLTMQIDMTGEEE